MTKSMDLQNNGRLDWFFNEWVFGTQVPKYKFNYELTPGADGETKFHATITQSEVDNHFAMLVSLYDDFGKGMIMLLRMPMIGSNTRTFDTELPVQILER